MKDVMPMVMKNKDVKMVTNDLSDKNTTAKSKTMLEKAGIYKFAKKNPATGMLYFFNAKTKKLLSKVSLAEPNTVIKKAYMEALPKKG